MDKRVVVVRVPTAAARRLPEVQPMPKTCTVSIEGSHVYRDKVSTLQEASWRRLHDEAAREQERRLRARMTERMLTLAEKKMQGEEDHVGWNRTELLCYVASADDSHTSSLGDPKTYRNKESNADDAELFKG